MHGHVHSLILPSIGFDPTLMPRQVHHIAEFLSDRFENRDTPSLFNRRTDCLTDIEYVRDVQGARTAGISGGEG